MPTWLFIHPKPLLISGVIALVASVLGAIIAGDVGQIGWHIGTIASAVGITVLIGLIPPKHLMVYRTIFVALVGAGALIIGISYIQNLTSWTWSTGSLASLGNRNSVGAGVALWGFATVLMFPRLRLLSVPAYAAVLFFIGGRTPLVAFLVGVICVIGFAVFQRLPKKWWVPSVLILAAFVGLLLLAPPRLHAWFTAYEEAAKNHLPTFSEKNFSAPTSAPEQYRAEWSEDATLGNMVHIVHAAGANENTILQRTIYEVPAHHAVRAGVTVRSAQPGAVTLAFAGATVACRVTPEWTTCRTGEAITETMSDARWELRGTEIAEIEVAAPFARIYHPGLFMGGDCDKDCSRRIRTLKSTFNRFNVLGWATDRNVTSRLEAQIFALRKFVEKPIAGWGLTTLRPVFIAEHPDQSAVDHSHNAMIDVLFERGLLGAITVVALLIGAIRSTRPRTHDLVFLLFFMVVLQMADSTFYFNLVYYPFWLALGLLRNPTPFSQGLKSPSDQTPA